MLFRFLKRGLSKRRKGASWEESQGVPPQPFFMVKREDLYRLEIEEDGDLITVTFVCSCELPVVKAGEDSFYCQHCDRMCDFQNCIWCNSYNQAF